MAEEEKPKRFGIRVNTSSFKVAGFTRAYLERMYKYPFSWGISTRNYVWLDIDLTPPTHIPTPEEMAELKERYRNDVIAIAWDVASRWRCHVDVYETPHGYHILWWRRFRHWRTVLRFVKTFYALFPNLIDRKWVEACERRGYLTLRINWIRRVYHA